MAEITAPAQAYVPEGDRRKDSVEATPQERAASKWEEISRQCWTSPDVSKCAFSPEMMRAKAENDQQILLAGGRTRDMISGFGLVDGAGSIERANFKSNDGKGGENSAKAQSILDRNIPAEQRLKTVNELVKAGVTSVDVTTADGKQHKLRLEAIGAGKSREMVHAFLSTENGKGAPLLRGIIDKDGSVEKQRDKKGRQVSFEGSAASRIEGGTNIKGARVEEKEQPHHHHHHDEEVKPVQPKRVENQRDSDQRLKPLPDPREVVRQKELEQRRERAEQPDGLGSKAARMLQPVTDRRILAHVPDAMYIGQSGKVTSTGNRGGETQQYWLAGDPARAFARAQEMLAAKGKSIIVSDKNGAGRTVDTQTEIYTRSNGGKSFAAGRPLASNHVRGNAMDISNYRDPDVFAALKAVGFRQGDSRGPIKNDEHHFSWGGTPRRRK